MYERTRAEIAPDYREVMRKLRAVDVTPYEKPKDLPQFEEGEALAGCGKIVLSQQFLGRCESCGSFRASEA